MTTGTTNTTTSGITEQEFFEQNGNDLHIRLLLFYNQYANKKEKKKQKDTDVLSFDFEGKGEYSITYQMLKEKADAETIVFMDKQELTFDKNNKVKKKDSN